MQVGGFSVETGDYRKGLGLRATDSVRETVGDWFEEASELMTRQQILFLFRAIHSRCGVVVNVTLATRNSPSLWKSLEGVVALPLLFCGSYQQFKEV